MNAYPSWPMAALILATLAAGSSTARAGDAAGDAAGEAADSTKSPGGSLSVVATPDTAGTSPAHPGAYGNPSFTKEEQEAADAKWRKDLERAKVDSLMLNKGAMLFLHAAPAAERRSTAQVARLARDCDSLVTAVPPGDWDVFLIAAGHDLLNGVAFSFGWPSDWIMRGFTLSPELKTPFSMGDLRAQDLRPTMVAFDCVVNEARKDAIPLAARHAFGDIVVIGKLEVSATSPGSLTLLDHSDARYGPPEVSNCWNVTEDIPLARRGRIDVGQGPGAKPCEAGRPLASNLMPPAAAQAATVEGKAP
jgi:hypothetical protein